MPHLLNDEFLRDVLSSAYDLGYFTDNLLSKIMGQTASRVSRYVDELEELGYVQSLGFAKLYGSWSSASGEWWRVTRKSTKDYPDVLPRRVRAQSWRKKPQLKRSRIVCSDGEIVEDHDAASVLACAWIVSELRKTPYKRVFWGTAHRLLTMRGLNPLVSPEQAHHLGIEEKITGGSPIPDLLIRCEHQSRPYFLVEAELTLKSAERYERIINSALAPNGASRLYVVWDSLIERQLSRIFAECGIVMKLVRYGDSEALLNAVEEICRGFTLDTIIHRAPLAA
jgi:hypothetical protein